MADNFIEVKIDTEGVITGAEAVKEILADLGESGAEAGRRLGEGIQEGLTNAFSNIGEIINQALGEGVQEGAGLTGMGADFATLNETISEVGSQISSTLADIRDFMVGFGEGLTEGLQNALGRTSKRMRGLAEQTSNATRQIKSYGGAVQKAEKHSNNMTKSITKGIAGFAKYALGIGTLVALFNKLRGVVKEGFGNLINSDKNFKKSMDELDASLTQLKNQLSSAFQPLASVVAPILSNFIQMVSNAVAQLTQLIALLSGQSYYNKAVKGTGDMAKNLGAGAKSAKEMKNYTSGLDELNVIGGDDSGGGAGAQNMFEQVAIDPSIIAMVDDLKNKIAEMVEKIKPFADLFMEGFKNAVKNIDLQLLMDKIKNIGEMLRNIFTDSKVVKSALNFAKKVSKALGQIVGAVASIGYSIALNLVGGIEMYLEENSKRVQQWIKDMFNINGETVEIWGNMAEAVADVFSVIGGENGQSLTSNVLGIFLDTAMGLSEVLAKLNRDITALTFQPFIDNVEGIKTALDNFLGSLDIAVSGIKDFADSVMDSLNAVYDESIEPFFEDITAGVSDSFGKFLEAYNTYVQPFVDDVAYAFSALWSEHLAPMFDNVLNFIGAIVEGLQGLYNFIKPIVDWIITNIIEDLIPWLLEGVAMFIDSIGGIIDIVGDIFLVLEGLIDFVVGVFTGDWEKAWEGILEIVEGVCDGVSTYFETLWQNITDTIDLAWDGIKTNFNKIIEGVEHMINSFIDGLNSFIEGINNAFDVELPEALGGGSLSLSIPTLSGITLPRLATGAVIPPNKEFMAVLGDQHNGTNIEAPLDTIKQALIEALDDSSFISYLASISDYTRATSEKDMTVKIGDRDIARANIRGQKQMGITLITSV